MKWHAYNKVNIPCPFCSKEIEVNYKPPMPTTRTSSSAAAGQKQSKFIEHEKYMSKDCPYCGAKGDKIEKALLDASSISKPKPFNKEEHLKKLEELGLTGRFGKKEI